MTRLICSFASGLLFCCAPTFAAPASAPASAPSGQKIEGIVVNHLGAGITDADVEITATDATDTSTPIAHGRTTGTGDIDIVLPPGRKLPVRIRIHKDGYTDYVQTIERSEDDETPYIDVTLEGSGKIEGTVTAAATDRPVAGATVRCENGGRQVEATTDAEGHYVIPQTERGPTLIEVSAEKFATGRKQVNITSGEERHDLRLKPERPVELTVVSSEGGPAPDVTIEAIVEPEQSYITAKTDEHGLARLRGIAGSATRLLVRLNGERFVHMPGFLAPLELATASAPAGENLAPFRSRLVAQLAATLKGIVVDAKTGQPIVGVRVISGREVRPDMPMIWSALDGTYELSGLSAGTNVVSWQHDDYATVVQEVPLAVGGTVEISMKLQPGMPVAGTVVDAEGKPLDQVWVTAESWKGYTTLGVRAITGKDGAFRLPHLPEGEIEFSFVALGYQPLSDEKLTPGRTDYKITLKGRDAEPTGTEPDVGDKVKVGDAAPDFTVTAVDGTVYKLSSLRGKYVFIDCWASWCGPCMGEIPNVKALYEALHKRPDFLLIGVSLDQEEAPFRKAVESMGMQWAVQGPRSGANETFEAFDGFAIPYTCLIGPDGKVIAQRLRGPGLVQEVQKAMANGAASKPAP